MVYFAAMTNPFPKGRCHIQASAGEYRHIDLFLVDQLGREIGVRVRFAVEEATLSETGAYDTEPGTWLVADVQATRNGEVYGASRPRGRFRTVEEREAYVAKRVEETRKRYQKKFGGVKA